MYCTPQTQSKRLSIGLTEQMETEKEANYNEKKDTKMHG